MKRIRKLWREFLRPKWYDYEWLVIGFIALGVLILGCAGFRLQLPEDKPVYWVDLIFKSFQLFVLQISVDPPMPWPLNVARILAPLVAGYTALQALGGLFADEFQSFRLRWLFRRHVVICGLGRKGLNLARGFLERGQPVVAIEQDAENDLVRQCRDLGGIVLLGDAAEPWLLRKAGVIRAAHLFALCGDDGVNAEIAVRTAQILTVRTGPPLTCVLHIFDAQLCTLLRERELETVASGQIRLEFFSVFELGARVLLEENPLCAAGEKVTGNSARLVIVGVGRLGESLLVNAARRWQTCRAAADEKLSVTLIDQDAHEITQVLLLRYPALKQLCELTPMDLDVHSASFQSADFLGTADTGAQTRVFVCLDDDSKSLSAALALVRRDHDGHPTIVVRMAQDAGLAMLLRDVDTGSSNFKYLRAFGLLDRTCHPDQVLRGTHEILARAIHEDYLRQQQTAGVRPEQNSSMVPWDALPDHLKESNREQADDVGAKLKAVHCSAAPLLDWDAPLFEFTTDEIERLARMEHDRWMAAKLQAGWRHGPKKDNEAKTHPCIASYDELPADELEKDRSTVRQIPAMLAKVGFRVHRLSRRQPGEHKGSAQ